MTPTSTRSRLDEMVAEVQRDPARIRVLFPAVARETGRGPVDPADPDGPRSEDESRSTLLCALGRAVSDPAQLADEVVGLYRYGDADEKRAVLLSLHQLRLGDAGLPLVEDALRTNDTRLVAAAMGRYGGEHLGPAAWRHGVLKCLFVGVPLSSVHDLQRRTDQPLVDMVTAYAEERRAAGREVPDDATYVLDHDPRSRES